METEINRELVTVQYMDSGCLLCCFSPRSRVEERSRKKKKTSFQKKMLRKKRRQIKEKKSGHAPKNPHIRDASSRLNRATFSFLFLQHSCCFFGLSSAVGSVGWVGSVRGLNWEKRVVRGEEIHAYLTPGYRVDCQGERAWGTGVA